MQGGFTDQAAEKDKFGIDRYILGLSTFIDQCKTPMTIGIQGDWGTGKTSIMRMVSNDLEKKNTAEMIWFNTWQFSQFNMGNQLAISLITCLLNDMSVSDEKGDRLRSVLKKVGNVTKNVGVLMVDANLGGKAADSVAAALGGEEENDLPKAITELKSRFEECIQSTLRKKNKERLVIFIDDLDRLQPSRAIELLEVLKLFLDCKSCVFVLAIDYYVVLRGVKEKYGASIGTDKGKSFFDKIIQVPFKVPVASYNITNYIKECFDEIGVQVNMNERNLGIYESLIRCTIGHNPRSMKRMFNAFLLLTNIASDELLTIEKNKQMLFAILCLQQSNETMYDYILRQRNNITSEMMEQLSDRDNGEICQFMADKKVSEKDREDFFEFMDHFKLLLDENNDNQFCDAEIEAFRTVLNFSSITSADTSGEKKKWERKEVESLEDLIAITETNEGIQKLYSSYATAIRSICKEKAEEKFYIGQKSVSFYIHTKSGKRKKLCEIQLNKTSLTLGLVYKTTQAMINKIDKIYPNITNHIGDNSTQINGIKNSDKMDEILLLIKEVYVHIYNERALNQLPASEPKVREVELV